MPLRKQLARTPEPLLPVGESQGDQKSHLGERGGSEREHEEERVSSSMKESRFQGGERARKVNLPRKSRRKHEQVGGCKSSSGGSGKS